MVESGVKKDTGREIRVFKEKEKPLIVQLAWGAGVRPGLGYPLGGYNTMDYVSQGGMGRPARRNGWTQTFDMAGWGVFVFEILPRLSTQAWYKWEPKS